MLVPPARSPSVRSRLARLTAAPLAAALLVAALTPVVPAQLDVLEVVSLADDESEGNGFVTGSSVSDDGRFVAFSGRASNLVEGTPEPDGDYIYLRDRLLGTTTLVTRDTEGNPSSAGGGTNVLMSGDGNWLVFDSFHSDLVEDDGNNTRDVFLYSVASGTIRRISERLGGGDANGGSFASGVSVDGSRVLFECWASDLVPADDNDEFDAYVWDRTADRSFLVSRPAGGPGAGYLNDRSFAGRLSANGRYATFNTEATNVGLGDDTSDRDGYVVDLDTLEVRQVTLGESGEQIGFFPATASGVSDDGRYVVFTAELSSYCDEDTNNVEDYYVRDMLTGDNELVSVASDGDQMFVHDVFLGGEMSADGRYVLFGTRSGVFQPGISGGHMDAYVRDRVNGVTEIVTVYSDGGFLPFDSTLYAMSTDGRFITYQNNFDLLPGETNETSDIYLLDRRRGSLGLEVTGDTAGAPVTFALSGGTPFRPAALLLSLGVQGLQGSAAGLITIGTPSFTVLLPLDGLGAQGFTRTMPPALAGQVLWSQGLDLATALLSPPVRTEVQ